MASRRPHLTVYNEISLDGKITGFDGDGVRYYRRGFRWRSDAILMGSVTAEAFGPAETVDEQGRVLPPLEPAPLPPGFQELVTDPRPLLVVPDSRGRIRNWRQARAQPWYGQLVVLASATTPTDYLDYLDRRGVDWLRAGAERVDLRLALDQLAERYDVRSVRTDSGGALSGALLEAGLVDRIAVIIAPRIGQDANAQVLVRWPAATGSDQQLRLLESEVLDDGAVWLVYDVVGAT